MSEETLLSILVRGAALLALVALGALALRRASAAHRHLAWAIGAAALLVLPAVSLTMPTIPWAVLPATSVRAELVVSTLAHSAAPAADAVAPSAAPTAQVDRTSDAAPDIALPAVAPSTPTRMPSPVILVWVAGVLVVASRLFVGARGVGRLVARSTDVADERVRAAADEAAARLGVARTPSVRASDDVDSPLTVGVFSPCVLLPTSALSWPADRLRLALVHEFAHVRRRDLLAEFVARLAVVVHWPNPLAWLAVSRLRIERERASDDLVLSAGNDAQEYAGFLVSLARALRPTPTVVAATMAGGPQFERRVEAILDERHSRLAPSARAGVLFALVASLSLGFAACVQPTTATQEDVRSDDAELKKFEAMGYIGGARPDASRAFESPPGQRMFKHLGAPVTVERDGSGQYASIAAALDAVPTQGLVRVGPGVFDERLVITKPVTIVGAGADKTTIVSDAPGPTLQVKGARDVVVGGVTLTGRGAHVEGGLAPGAVIDVSDAGARFEGVAVVGGPASGVSIGQGSDVTIDGCFVAAVWNTGVVVGAPGERPSTVRVANCDIRNCRYAGVTIARGNRAVTVEGCRISGASWHGIRYDDASPTVKGNLIFENARSGIYASGKTEGRIEGNLFFRNEMSDVSCWFDARDAIEGNTFVESQREAVAILGASNPVVRKNVFFGCKIALFGSGHDDGKGAELRYGGGGTIDANVFWKNGTDFQKPGADGKSGVAQLTAGNTVADPQFADVAKRDYSLPSGAAAGVATPLTFESPWPARPDETATAPKPELAAARAKMVQELNRSMAFDAANNRVSALKADILQIVDADRRERGLVELGAAMRSDDPQLARAALAALPQLRDVKYDKARFRPDVLRHLESPDAVTRRAAGLALLQVERDPGDLDRVLTLAERSPDRSDNLRFVALTLAGNRAEGRLAKVFVAALATDDGQEAMDTANDLRRMWVAPEVEDAVVAAWRRHPTGRNGSGMWPYIFGQITSPARESRVRAVFEMLATGDDAKRELAGPAVTTPVDESACALAAQLAADGIATAPTAALRRTYLDVIRANGGREQVATLRALVDNAMVGDELRALAGKTADELERR